ncbi:ABC transporter transmembrane region-domain-containing protein [Jimgerdemannia flammicorona]|uniref:ABC transporter transmembrane region-domain-containing protein n=1 Tax=Jimgerdemannia flammicorona TaxID=994334 RepID=A0A433Q765_9FUNG|nr:ABC transporter transmembrane region-domain-containing protein [Jimgerdemannia flammicorona]
MIHSHLNAIYAVAFLISLVDLRLLYLVHSILSIDFMYAVALANSLVTLVLCVVVASECNKYQPVRRTENRCYLSKEVNASMYSRFMFNWVNSMMKEGYSCMLNDEDLPELSVENRTKYILAHFHEHHVTSLLLSLGYSSCSELTIQVFYALIWSIFIFSSAYFLNLIIGFIEKAPFQREPVFTAYLYIFGLFISNVVQSLSFQHVLYIGRVLHIRIRSIIIGEVYAKALCRHDTTKDETKTKIGNIINLVSVDTQKIGELSTYIFYIYAYPIQILICIWLLWRLLGYSTMFGIAVIIVTYPLPTHLSNMYKNSHKDVMQATDKHMTLMNELLHAMSTVKFFAWESQFRFHILNAHENELRAIRSRLMQYLWIGNVWFIIPILIMLSMFMAHTKLAGNELTTTVAFTALALFTNLRFVLDEMPFIVSSILQTRVALRCVVDFLAEPEINRDAHEVRIGKAEFIGFKNNASFQWFYNAPNDTDAGPNPTNLGQIFKLKNLNISFPPGELSIVCGPTGCGKTSLISSLMGEMNCLTGYAVLPCK